MLQSMSSLAMSCGCIINELPLKTTRQGNKQSPPQKDTPLYPGHLKGFLLNTAQKRAPSNKKRHTLSGFLSHTHAKRNASAKTAHLNKNEQQKQHTSTKTAHLNKSTIHTSTKTTHVSKKNSTPQQFKRHTATKTNNTHTHACVYLRHFRGATLSGPRGLGAPGAAGGPGRAQGGLAAGGPQARAGGNLDCYCG